MFFSKGMLPAPLSYHSPCCCTRCLATHLFTLRKRRKNEEIEAHLLHTWFLNKLTQFISIFTFSPMFQQHNEAICALLLWLRLNWDDGAEDHQIICKLQIVLRFSCILKKTTHVWILLELRHLEKYFSHGMHIRFWPSWPLWLVENPLLSL